MENLAKDFFFPVSCAICAEPDTLLCPECAAKLEKAHLKCLRCGKRNPAGRYCEGCKKSHLPERAEAVFRYDGAAKELVHLMKYKDFQELSKPLGAILAAHLKKTIESKDYAVCFVPVHRSRRRYRGYNQAELLACEVARILDLEFCDLLKRTMKTESQVELLDHDARRQNIKNCIVAHAVAPAKVILIDDVITSGATIEECTKILKRAGAREVICAAVAMG